VRLGTIAESPIEAVIRRLNVAPTPLIETQIAYTLARVVMAGVRLGVFDALVDGDATAAQVAQRCGTDPRATEKLLFALAGARYVRATDSGYGLTPMSRKWLASDSEHSLADKLLLQFHEWNWLELSEEYVRTGKPLELHQVIDEDQWNLYQRGMRSMARGLGGEVVRRMPVPEGARDMLDIGGSHGYYSVALCRRHEGLRSVVLDLPQAVKQAAPLLAEEGMGEVVVHREGDALSDDLGEGAYDLVITVQLVHHFSEEQNRDLTKRIAQALRPGGVYAILEEFRSPTPKDAGQVGALLDFYFALTSQSGTWSPEEMADWQRAAGLEPRKAIHFRTLPGSGIQAATKPGR
jgi:SAM-dependent methyltransferase